MLTSTQVAKGISMLLGVNLLLAILHFLRGRGILNKIVSSLLSGLVIGVMSYLVGHTFIISSSYALVSAVGIYLGVLIGWGKYFSAFHGRYNINEKEFFLADWAGDYTFKKTGNGYAAGLVGMTVRASLLYPLFIALGCYIPAAFIYGLLVFTLGIIYWLMRFIPEKYAVPVAEFITPFLNFGLALYLSIS